MQITFSLTDLVEEAKKKATKDFSKYEITKCVVSENENLIAIELIKKGKNAESNAPTCLAQ